jgi:pilus assembly protein CpaE
MDDLRDLERVAPATGEAPGISRSPMEDLSGSPIRNSASKAKLRTDMSADFINVVALLRSPATAEALKKAIAGASGTALQTKIAASFDLATLRALQGDVILLEMDGGNAGENAILAEFVADRAVAPVVVTSPHLEVATMRELMQIGVLDVIPQPMDGSDISATLRKAFNRRHPALKAASGKRGSVITFIGSGGGVGSTSLAVQGAYALSRGKNAPSVCLLDLDIQFGTAALLLDAEQRHSILDLIRDPTRLDGTLLRGSTVRPRDRLDLLASPATIEPMEGIDAAAVAATVETASRTYALTIIDLPTLWSHWTHAVMERSTVIVLVVHLTVPALRQARRQIEMLERENLDGIPLVVVANRVEGGLFARSGVSLKAAASVLRRKVDCRIPKSPAMPLAADAGLPLENVTGGSSLQKRVVAMMQQVVTTGQRAETSVEKGR